MLKRNLKLVQATRNAGAIPIAVNEPILVSMSLQFPGPYRNYAKNLSRFYRSLLRYNCFIRWVGWEECETFGSGAQ